MRSVSREKLVFSHICDASLDFVYPHSPIRERCIRLGTKLNWLQVKMACSALRKAGYIYKARRKIFDGIPAVCGWKLTRKGLSTKTFQEAVDRSVDVYADILEMPPEEALRFIPRQEVCL